MPNIVPFPGEPIDAGSTRADAVTLLQQRLNERGCGPIPLNGTYGPETTRAVKLFQARFTDAKGHPLVVDGVVGPVTWAALFGAPPVVAEAPASVATAALTVAEGEIGQMERPPGSNRGPRVDEYVRAVGLDPAGAFPWCAAFVYWCFGQAATAAGVRNPVIKTGGVLEHWRLAEDRGIVRVTGEAAKGSPELVRPGFVFMMDFGGGAGSTM